MYKQVLRAITDVGVFGSISLIIFVTLFLIVFISVVRAKKEFIQQMANLPLED